MFKTPSFKTYALQTPQTSDPHTERHWSANTAVDTLSQSHAAHTVPTAIRTPTAGRNRAAASSIGQKWAPVAPSFCNPMGSKVTNFFERKHTVRVIVHATRLLNVS